MPTQSFISSIKGLIPLIDRKKAQEPYVVNGQNFVMDADGPYSGLGRTVLSYKAINNPSNIQSFKISENIESIIATNEGLFRYDTETGKLNILYKTSSLITAEFPWSAAAVGNKYYFARKGSDLIEYDIVNDSWQILTGGSIPVDIYACTESEGRLILLTSTHVLWSTIGDGQDFNASSATGAGGQALTKMGISNSRPLGLKKTPEGFLTFLSTGIMRSQAIEATIPFRTRVLSRENHIPINPYCITSIETNSVVILTKEGFFETKGEIPKPWQPLMGEYFHKKILPSLDIINNQNNIQLDYHIGRSWFCVSIAETQQDYIYTKAFILDSKIGEWGVLNGGFRVLTDLYSLPSQFSGFTYTIIDVEGTILRFDDSTGIEQIPPLNEGYSYYNFYEEINGIINDGVLILSMKGEFSTVSKLLKTQTGVYYDYAQIQGFVSPTTLTSTEKPATVLVPAGNAADPINELNTTTDVVGVDLDTLVSQNTNVNVGSYAVRVGSTSYPSNVTGNRAYIDIETRYGLKIGVTYQLSIDLNLFTGTNGYLYLGATNNSLTTLAIERDSDDTSWMNHTYNFVHSANSKYLIFTRNADFDWEIDFDNLSLCNLGCDSVIVFNTNTTFAFEVLELKTKIQDPDYSSLDSFIEIGPIRLTNNEDNDRFSYISNVAVGTLNTISSGDTEEDWNSETQFPIEVTEDWLILSGSEDWGSGNASSVNYTFNLIPTLDAFFQIEDYTPVAKLVNSNTQTDFFSCQSDGIYHLLKFTALNNLENYHVKTLDITLNLGGRLI